MRVGARGVTPSFAILREGGMTEKIYLRMRSCVSGRQQNHKKIKKNQERIIRHCLKKNVPAGSNAYLRICYFLKKSQPKATCYMGAGPSEGFPSPCDVHRNQYILPTLYQLSSGWELREHGK
jgi:hypothetical protein